MNREGSQLALVKRKGKEGTGVHGGRVRGSDAGGDWQWQGLREAPLLAKKEDDGHTHGAQHPRLKSGHLR